MKIDVFAIVKWFINGTQIKRWKKKKLHTKQSDINTQIHTQQQKKFSDNWIKMKWFRYS